MSGFVKGSFGEKYTNPVLRNKCLRLLGFPSANVVGYGKDCSSNNVVQTRTLTHPNNKKTNWKRSEELLSKSKMIRKLVKYYSKEERTYLYNDFYKLTNYTIELLLKEKEGVKE